MTQNKTLIIVAVATALILIGRSGPRRPPTSPPASPAIAPALVSSTAASSAGASATAIAPTPAGLARLGARVRPPAVAGQFYSDNPRELSATVDALLSGALALPVRGELIAVQVPHAGYAFSGPVAAFGYKILAASGVSTFVILGPSHHAPVAGAAVTPYQAFATPLGDVPIDRALQDSIQRRCPLIVTDPGPHEQEHSLEVQLPFLQRCIAHPQVVPIAVGAIGLDEARRIGEAVAQGIREARQRSTRVLIIASTDLSHYPAADLAEGVDTATLQLVEEMDPAALNASEPEILSRGLPNLACTACGMSALVTTMVAARSLGADTGSLIRYGNSADQPPHDTGRVVGYGVVAFSRVAPEATAAAASPVTPGAVGAAGQARTVTPVLSGAAGERLLATARASIASSLGAGSAPALDTTDPALAVPVGAFVTLRVKGQLRGCVGIVQPVRSLIENVARAARMAAAEDPRFSPVRAGELAGITIEVSALSPRERVAHPEDIQPGVHGVLMRRGEHQGLFLPQVWKETGWDRESFLSNLAQEKAGLPRDAWKQPDTALEVFTVAAFEEKVR